MISKEFLIKQNMINQLKLEEACLLELSDKLAKVSAKALVVRELAVLFKDAEKVEAVDKIYKKLSEKLLETRYELEDVQVRLEAEELL